MDKKEQLHKAIYGLEETLPEYSVRLWLNAKNRVYFLLIPLLFMIALIMAPQQVFLSLFFLLNCLYFITQIFKLLLLIIGAFASKAEENLAIPLRLPIYTILLPIYHEDKILENLIKAIEAIDYPSNLMDVKLLIEHDDDKALYALKKIKLPDFFEVIQVPVAYPRTKPKACNYGLQFAKGKYITVYDAEDRPDPQQLKQIVAKCTISSPEVVCIQARLNYYNRQENYLTKLFALEYSLLFDYMLVGLKKLAMPIPLGGTSNHFIREKLVELGGWDAFNVTEDADLGIRLHHRGYRTDLIASTTFEESPINLQAWLMQRARWIKGHVLTSLLHLKQSHKLKLKEILGISFCLYLPNMIYLLLPIYLVVSCFVIEIGKADLFWQLNLLLGIILPIAQSIFVILAKKWHNMKSSIILVILYYWLLPVAGIRACWQIFVSPFRWDKTEHGVSNFKEL